jgi:uncharacterized protein YjbI with pentapeptide repeats
MARPWIRSLGRIAVIAIAVIAALTLPWALSVSWLWRWLPKQGNIWIVVAIAVDAILVLLAAIWWLWWRLPQRQVARLALKIRDPKARADTEDNFRKTVGQALGGAAVLIGAGAAYLQFTQQQQASRDLLISNQVAKGFEQLASKESIMRLGGIYGLEGVMNTSPQYHQPVLEALCAFVRVSTEMKQTFDKPAADIQAALTVIGRRADGPGGVDLQRAVISRAVLINATLSNATLWLADLIQTDLGGANLSGANLTSSDLKGAFLNFANLSGAYLNLANLSGADLESANLSGANLSGARNLTQDQLGLACGEPATLPGDLKLAKPCAVREYGNRTRFSQ